MPFFLLVIVSAFGGWLSSRPVLRNAGHRVTMAPRSTRGEGGRVKISDNSGIGGLAAGPGGRAWPVPFFVRNQAIVVHLVHQWSGVSSGARILLHLQCVLCVWGARHEKGGVMMSEPMTTKTEIEQAVEDFARENPDVMEALQVFGIATSEYEQALRALNPSVTHTESSTQPAQ